MVIGAGSALSAPGASEKRPTEVVETLIDQLRRYRHADEGKLSEAERRTNARIAAEINRHIDIEGLAERSIGPTWNKLTPARQRDFVRLLAQLFERVAYPNSAEVFDADHDMELDDRGRRGDRHVITVSVSHATEGTIQLDFFLTERERGYWRLVDVHLDGVSMADNLRSEMQSIIREESYDELVRRIREKIEEEET